MNSLDKLCPLSQEIIEKYQVRKTRKQKTNFINFLKDKYPELKVQNGGFAKNRNLILGDINKADTIVTAHYDTCAVLPFPNLLLPNNIFLTLLVQVFFVVFFITLFNISISLILSAFNVYLKFSFLITETNISCLLLIFIMMFGKPNKHTMNDNTSGVITLIETINSYQDEKVAYVFFDNEEYGLLGSAYFSKINKETLKNKLIINIDCVSDGDNIAIISAKKHFNKNKNKVENTFVSDQKNIIHVDSRKFYYPSDQLNFKNYMAIAAFNKHKRFGYYVDKIHTAKDLAFDQNNILLIRDSLIRFFKF